MVMPESKNASFTIATTSDTPELIESNPNDQPCSPSKFRGRQPHYAEQLISVGGIAMWTNVKEDD